jgi:hypothetical protein
MKIRDLLSLWDSDAADPLSAEEFRLRLPIHDAAKVCALAELFPGRTPDQIVVDLLSAALDELQAQFPYVRGERITARDEQGDPIYEDVGLGPRYHELIRAHVQRLKLQLDK